MNIRYLNPQGYIFLGYLLGVYLKIQCWGCCVLSVFNGPFSYRNASCCILGLGIRVSDVTYSWGLLNVLEFQGSEFWGFVYG